MKVHEFQAKELLRRYKVPLLAGEHATTPEGAVEAAKRIGGPTGALEVVAETEQAPKAFAPEA